MSDKKPQSSTGKDIVAELERLNDSVEDLYDLVDKASRKARKPQIMSGLIQGAVSAIGVLIATAVIAVVIIYAGQAFLRSDAFQEWFAGIVQGAIEKSAQNAYDSFF